MHKPGKVAARPSLAVMGLSDRHGKRISRVRTRDFQTGKQDAKHRLHLLLIGLAGAND